MDRMVGRAPGREQADRGVDDRLFVDTAGERTIIVAVPADLGDPVRRGARQFLPQFGAGVGEGAARDVQPHQLHHHLVAIRSEEHTSELQSLMRLSYAFFCLKKQTYTPTDYSTT